jgi:hypothetical protein
MKRLTIVAIGTLVLGGCTGTHIKPVSVCDGKHRRPANLYGSILPSLPVPLPASQQGSGQSMVAPPSGEPAPAPRPAPAPTPGAGGAPAPIGPGAMDIPRPAPRTSARDIAPTYSSC